MVQLAPDASPLSRRLQPKKKKKMHTLVLLAWPGHLCILTLIRRETVLKPMTQEAFLFPKPYKTDHISSYSQQT